MQYDVHDVQYIATKYIYATAGYYMHHKLWVINNQLQYHSSSEEEVRKVEAYKAAMEWNSIENDTAALTSAGSPDYEARPPDLSQYHLVLFTQRRGAPPHPQYRVL